jgi:hypothetical protein
LAIPGLVDGGVQKIPEQVAGQRLIADLDCMRHYPIPIAVGKNFPIEIDSLKQRQI